MLKLGELSEGGGMSEWQHLKLGELITLNYGKALKAEDRKPGNVPVFSSAGQTGTHDQCLVNSEGIIIGRKGTVGKVYYSAEPFCCIDTAYYITPKLRELQLPISLLHAPNFQV